MSPLEAFYAWLEGDGFVWLLLAAWLVCGVLALGTWARARRELSDPGARVDDAPPRGRPSPPDPGKDTAP